jgi:hypothetical protein
MDWLFYVSLNDSSAFEEFGACVLIAILRAVSGRGHRA